ncbi:MAG: hypothetical protein H6Q25_402 [Bacteroidetes bacterium]|nr:hypothetical protein [Bacteroidota bacterium]
MYTLKCTSFCVNLRNLREKKNNSTPADHADLRRRNLKNIQFYIQNEKEYRLLVSLILNFYDPFSIEIKTISKNNILLFKAFSFIINSYYWVKKLYGFT